MNIVGICDWAWRRNYRYGWGCCPTARWQRWKRGLPLIQASRPCPTVSQRVLR